MVPKFSFSSAVISPGRLSSLGPTGALEVSHRVICLLIVCSIGFASPGCSKKAEGHYRGICENTTVQVRADLVIDFREDPGNVLAGNMIIGAPLEGGGAIWGRREGKRLQFSTTTVGGKITWFGEIHGKDIAGEYFVEPTGEMAAAFGGAVEKQQGQWLVRKQ